ncbi:HNH endonuclease [Hahella sp. HN01]|uniref:HNH endonuclease n=1 Tax=Hahella sp. HN01 TaxID=2847262 RepID=UPI001C1EFC02|nr:HNH endonuclease signature motif containing protein [Hahella sp. HN01]MBU6955752.1 HNH endonuclease [Hahella sp. HN01]
MPQASLRPCKDKGCPNTTRHKSRYCESHADKREATRWGVWQQQKGSDTQRGYGWQWRKLRVRILRRDNYLCQVCLKQGRTSAATEVDHIQPKAGGGDDQEMNLQAICNGCHRSKTGNSV